MLPQFKPLMAIVIITGVSLGAESGFLTGAVAGFVSNFFSWTGTVDTVADVRFRHYRISCGTFVLQKARYKNFVREAKTA